MKNILIVDDDSFIRNLMVSYFEKCGGFRIFQAENGQAAWSVLDRHHLDLVLLDVNLPDIEGFEILKKLRMERSPLELPVMLVTALHESVDMIKGFNLGANEFITKPIDLPVVLARIRNLLNLREAFSASTAETRLLTAKASKPRISVRSRREGCAERQPDKLITNHRYSYEETLGQGGFASVYLVKDLVLQRKVAMKVLERKYAFDETTRKCFLGEAQVTAQFDHPNIVSIYQMGEFGGAEVREHLDFPDAILAQYSTGFTFFTMQYVQGETLGSQLAEAGVMSPDRGLPVLIDVAKALQFAHRQGVVHRDIKPHNILISNDGQVLVTDFGLARPVDKPGVISRFSEILRNIDGNNFACTPNYASPEQLSEEAADHRSDIYSFGIVAFEMFAGKKPFESSSIHNLIKQQLLDKPPRLEQQVPGFPRALSAIVATCLEKNPSHRYPDMDTVLQKLWSLRSGSGQRHGHSDGENLPGMLGRAIVTEDREISAALLFEINEQLTATETVEPGQLKAMGALLSDPEALVRLIRNNLTPGAIKGLLRFLKNFDTTLPIFAIVKCFREAGQDWQKESLARLAVLCSGENLMPLVLFGLKLEDTDAALLLHGFSGLNPSLVKPALARWARHPGEATRFELLYLIGELPDLPAEIVDILRDFSESGHAGISRTSVALLERHLKTIESYTFSSL